jgi:hypothetical protein
MQKLKNASSFVAGACVLAMSVAGFVVFVKDLRDVLEDRRLEKDLRMRRYYNAYNENSSTKGTENDRRDESQSPHPQGEGDRA